MPQSAWSVSASQWPHPLPVYQQVSDHIHFLCISQSVTISTSCVSASQWPYPLPVHQPVSDHIHFLCISQSVTISTSCVSASQWPYPLPVHQPVSDHIHFLCISQSVTISTSCCIFTCYTSPNCKHKGMEQKVKGNHRIKKDHDIVCSNLPAVRTGMEKVSPGLRACCLNTRVPCRVLAPVPDWVIPKTFSSSSVFFSPAADSKSVVFAPAYSWVPWWNKIVMKWSQLRAH